MSNSGHGVLKEPDDSKSNNDMFCESLKKVNETQGEPAKCGVERVLVAKGCWLPELNCNGRGPSWF